MVLRRLWWTDVVAPIKKNSKKVFIVAKFLYPKKKLFMIAQKAEILKFFIFHGRTRHTQ